MTSDNVKHSDSACYCCRNLFAENSGNWQTKAIHVGGRRPWAIFQRFFRIAQPPPNHKLTPAIIEHPGMPSDTLYWPEYKCSMRFVSVQGLEAVAALTVIFRHLHHQLAHRFHLSFENLTKRRVSTSDSSAADPDIAPTRPRIRRCGFASHFGFFIGHKTSPSPA